MKKLIVILIASVFFISCEKEPKLESESYFFIGEWTVEYSGSPHLSEPEPGWSACFVISDTINNTVVMDTSFLSYIVDGTVYCSDMYPSYFEIFNFDFTDLGLYIDLRLNSTQHHVFDGKYRKDLNKFIGCTYYYETHKPEKIELWGQHDYVYKGLVKCDVIND